MKSAAYLCLFAPLLASAVPFETPPPHPPQLPTVPTVPTVPALSGLSRTMVPVPYSELKALWEAAQPKLELPKEDPLPPVPFLLHRAELRLQLGESAGILEAEFQVENLHKSWQTIPLLGGDARLDQFEAGQNSVIWKDGYALLTEQPGKTSVSLRLATRGAKQLLESGEMKLMLGNAPIKRMSVSGVPDGFELRVNGRPASRNKDGIALVYLPGEQSEVSVEIAKPVPLEIPKPLPPITLSHWEAPSQSLVRFSEGRLRFQSRIYARANDGSGLEMSLVLPPNAGSISVSGDDLNDWNQSRAEDGTRILRVRWKTRDVLDRELSVTYALPQSPLADTWKLQAPAVLGEPQGRHLYTIVSAPGLELKGQGLQAMLETRRLPEWMRSEIGSEPFATAEAGNEFLVSTHWLPKMTTAEAIVSRVEARLRLVGDGATQTSVVYTIKHNDPLGWALELPAAVELLSCTVAGVAAQPVKGASGALELTLPTPDRGTKGQSEVALVYTSKTQALDPVSGQVALELPKTALFIEHLEWRISIPTVFEVTANEGNVTAMAQAGGQFKGGDDGGICFQKDFCRAERPRVALFYERRSLQK